MFKKGPEIKLSAMRVPDAILDVYYDLRTRRLLPLVALLVVAIIAVPIALTQSSGPAGFGSAIIPTPSAEAGQTSDLVFAKATPGLRAYRRRLSHLQAKDPFKQQFAGAESAIASASAGSPTSGVESEASAPSSESSPSSSSPTESSTTVTTHHLVYLSYAIDARIVPVKTQKNGHEAKPQVRHNLPELTPLPSRSMPAAIFTGVSEEGEKALLLLSSQVEAVAGGGTCLLGSETCQLLALKPGVPETFVYGPQGRTFKIELLRIHLVASKKQRRAPLGKGSGHAPQEQETHRLAESIQAPASRAIEVSGPDSSP